MNGPDEQRWEDVLCDVGHVALVGVVLAGVGVVVLSVVVWAWWTR